MRDRPDREIPLDPPAAKAGRRRSRRRRPARPDALPAGPGADPSPRPFWLRPEIDWPLARMGRANARPGRAAPEEPCTGSALGPAGCTRALCRRHGTCRAPGADLRALLAGGPPGGLGALFLYLAGPAGNDASDDDGMPSRARYWLSLGARLRGLMQPALFDDPDAFEAAQRAHDLAEERRAGARRAPGLLDAADGTRALPLPAPRPDVPEPGRPHPAQARSGPDTGGRPDAASRGFPRVRRVFDALP
jgi:hypothetical protein